jgi:hypothetical protein
MSLIDTRTAEPAKNPQRKSRGRRFRVIRALEDLAGGRVGLLYLPGAGKGRTDIRRSGHR